MLILRFVWAERIGCAIDGAYQRVIFFAFLLAHFIFLLSFIALLFLQFTAHPTQMASVNRDGKNTPLFLSQRQGQCQQYYRPDSFPPLPCLRFFSTLKQPCTLISFNRQYQQSTKKAQRHAEQPCFEIEDHKNLVHCVHAFILFFQHAKKKNERTTDGKTLTE